MRTITVDVTQLSERHIRALAYYINKFIRGAIEHGDLAPKKEWTKDMLDEVNDKSFYEIFTLLDMFDIEQEVNSGKVSAD